MEKGHRKTNIDKSTERGNCLILYKDKTRQNTNKSLSRKNTVKKKHLTVRFFSCMIPTVMQMEKIVRQTMLYDFYGDLLTEHQRRVYEDAVLGDMSLSEMAEEQGISRQGVHDLIRRCDRTMEEYEEKLHLIRKFSQTRELVEQIRKTEDRAQVQILCDQILECL